MTNKTKKKPDWAKSQPKAKKLKNEPKKASKLPTGSITTQELFDQIMGKPKKEDNASIPSWAKNARAASATQRPTNSHKFLKRGTSKPKMIYFDVESGGLDGSPIVTYSTKKDGSDAKTFFAKGLSEKELTAIAESIATVGIRPADITQENLRKALKKYNELLGKSNASLARGTAIHKEMEEKLKSRGIGPSYYDVAGQGNHEPIDIDEEYVPTEEEKAATAARLAKFRERYGRPSSTSANFMQVVPNSHFWTDLRMLRNYLKYQPQSEMRDHLLTGLKNTLNNGYDLVKLGLDAEPGPGTFWKRQNLLSTTSVAVKEDGFTKIMIEKQPKEIWKASDGKNKLEYKIVKHFLAGGNKRKPGCTVWHPQLGPGRTEDVTYGSLYRKLIAFDKLTAYTYR